MTIRAQVLFDRPQQAVAPQLRQLIAAADAVEIAVGFATPSGIETIAPALRTAPGKLRALVVGKATERGFAAIDSLIASGVPQDRFYVHLGHTAIYSGPNTFHQYHPMLHEKIYYMQLPDGHAAAMVGSHNLTEFALGGKNGEASVLLEGPVDDPEFVKIRAHLQECRDQATPYDQSMKDAYTWWAAEYVEGLRKRLHDGYQDDSSGRTLLVLAEAGPAQAPRRGETIYFEVAADLRSIQALEADVHVYLFDLLPQTPTEALNALFRARHAFECKALGLELKAGGKQLQADWSILDRRRPRLAPVPNATLVRSAPATDKQVRVEIRGRLTEHFEYLFESSRQEWRPIYASNGPSIDADTDALGRDRGRPARASTPPIRRRKEVTGVDSAVLHGVDGIRGPAEHRLTEMAGIGTETEAKGEWRLVRGLEPTARRLKQKTRQALYEASPESGSFVLMSYRRKLREPQDQSG